MTDWHLTGSRVVSLTRLVHGTYHIIIFSFACVSPFRCNFSFVFGVCVGRLLLPLLECLCLSFSCCFAPVCLMAFLNLRTSHLVSCDTMGLYPGLNGRLAHHLISVLFSSIQGKMELILSRNGILIDDTCLSFGTEQRRRNEIERVEGERKSPSGRDR
jgi:hypothetical protein